MALRLIEISLPESEKLRIDELKNDESIELWQEDNVDSGILIRVLIPADKTENLMDELEKKFNFVDGFRVVMLPVEATLPRPVPKEETEKKTAELTPEEQKAKKEKDKTAFRIGREELYAEITDNINLNRIFIAMVILSSIVAAIGLLRDNVAVVIGAMVIAPLLGPNVGLSFAIALGDFKLGKEALKTNLAGVFISLGLAIIIGYIFGVQFPNAEISSRTSVELSDIILALAAGTAGVLALSSGVSTALIGVMVAVALLPPLVTFGLLIGSGNYQAASGAFLLLSTNLICVNLAGVMTFIAQGIRPRTWWEAEKAKKASKTALILLSVLLIILAVLIYFSQQWFH